jgi:hypothetical protein
MRQFVLGEHLHVLYLWALTGLKCIYMLLSSHDRTPRDNFATSLYQHALQPRCPSTLRPNPQSYKMMLAQFTFLLLPLSNLVIASASCETTGSDVIVCHSCPSSSCNEVRRLNPRHMDDYDCIWRDGERVNGEGYVLTPTQLQVLLRFRGLTSDFHCAAVGYGPGR